MTREQLEAIAEDPKAFLRRGYKITGRISAKRERIAFWREQAESITGRLKQDGGAGACGYVESPVANAVAEIITLEEHIGLEIQRLVHVEREVSEAINLLLADPRHVALMEMRYVNQFRLEEVAVRLGYAFRWAQRLHGKALQKMKEAALSALDSRYNGSIEKSKEPPEL